MTDKDLIELLRSKRICAGFKPDGFGDVNIVYGPDPVTAEAADRIEALTAERDEAWAYMSALQGDLYDAVMIEAEHDRLREALIELVQHTHNCERQLTEDLHHVDFCGESVPLTNAREALKGETP